MPRMTGAAAIVQSLLANGVDTLFGLPGVQMDPFYNALYDAGEAIRVIQSRHEQGAAYMAQGYAQATGGPGAYAVVPGPGVLNTTAALATAYATNDRVLCVAGQVPSAYIGRGVGLLHEIPDQLGVLRSLTKWAQRIERPGDAPGLVREAFRRLASGRPRPVALEMAMDVMAQEAEVGAPEAATADPPPPVDEDAVEEAARLLGRAGRPLIFVGGGAMDAGEEVQRVAETLQAPVIAGRSGRGVLSSRHPLSHTMPTGHRLWADADVVLAVGTRLQHPQMNWGLDEQLKLIRINIDPDEHDRVTAPAVRITADSRDALRALLARLERHNRRRASRTEELAGVKAEVEASYAKLEPQLAYARAIRAELPDDGIYVDDLTQVSYVARFAMPVCRPRTFLCSGYQGTLGRGVAAGIGVKAARPGRPVVAVIGDGGFMYTMPELATAVQHRIGVVIVVFNDSAYGNVKRMQEELYGNRVIASELQNPDFVRLAEAFGAQGLRATTPEALREALRRGFGETGPTVIEVPVGAMPGPWEFIMMPPVRGLNAGGPVAF